MFLLDTNVVSELRKVTSGKAHPAVIAWNQTINPIETFISAIVLHELEIGIRLAEHADVVAGRVLRNWLNDNVLPAFSGRILPLNEAVALKAAQWHVPNPRPINDAYIAATALVRRMVLVTRNMRDFEGMAGLRLISPWEHTA
ncbi:MAG: type II toxin-antitoxin system VapC family toxin [Rhodanobacter sp.]|jgi:predicted nucleic acid-binding protein|nr:type II toxin-antitoxin system VapC family toxin [Rhodanobacter sp.]